MGQIKTCWVVSNKLNWLAAIFLFFHFCHSQADTSLPATIRIGAIFIEGDESAAREAAFRHAIDLVNADRNVLVRSRLTAHIEKIPHGDSFRASQKVCQMVQQGVAAIVGPNDPSVAAHIQSMSEVLKVPFIETRFDYTFTRPEYTLNVHPHPSTMGKAYANLVDNLGWKSLVILYENEDSLVKLQEVLKLPSSFDSIKITMRQLYTNTDDFRPQLKEIKRSGETRVILDCNFNKIGSILRQADEIGLISDYHNYLITGMNLERLSLSPYKYNNVNITGFRLVDTSFTKVAHYLKKWNYNIANSQGDGHPLFVQNVLTYDAVRMIAKALDDISATADTLHIDQLDCRQPTSWAEGEKLMSYLQRVEYHGITGEMHFDMNAELLLCHILRKTPNYQKLMLQRKSNCLSSVKTFGDAVCLLDKYNNILEDSCLALSDLVLLQHYFYSDLNVLDLKISQTNTTSVFSNVSTTEGGLLRESRDGGQDKFESVSTTEGGLLCESTDGGKDKFEKSEGNVMFSQPPHKASFKSFSVNSEMSAKRDSKLPSELGNETEKTGLSFSGTIVSGKVVDGTGLAKQPKIVLKSEMVVAPDSDKVLFSFEMGAKETEKSSFDDPDKVKLKVKSDILLENRVKDNIESEKPTSCYKGVNKFS